MKRATVVILLLTFIALAILIILSVPSVFDTLQAGLMRISRPSGAEAGSPSTATEPATTLPGSSSPGSIASAGSASSTGGIPSGGGALPASGETKEVVTECRLAPKRSLELGFQSAGPVEEVLVEEGQLVAAGQALARLGGRKAAEAAIASAQYELNSARQVLKDLQDAAILDAARAFQGRAATALAVVQAEQRLEDLTDQEADPEEIDKAQADLALERVKLQDAQQSYEMLKNGPDPERVALAESRIANAEAQLAAAQEALPDLELVAPFAGTVARLDIQTGAYATPGAPALLLVDFSGWQVETLNLDELNIVRIQPGDEATITFDALPDRQFAGQVRKISPVGENVDGDIVYTAILVAAIDDPALRWNMSCVAKIAGR